MKSRVKMKSRVRTKAAARAKAKAPTRRKAPKVQASSKSSKSSAGIKSPGGSKTPDQLDTYIIAVAGALNIRVEKSWMRAVRSNLRVTLDQAAIVAEFALPDDAEPAPVFRA